jgi:hypothetical protein
MEQRRERQREHALMSNLRSRRSVLSHVHVALLALAGAAALGACSKTDSPPNGFGVNITVDATMIAPAARAQITTDKLTIVSDKSATPVTRVLADLPKALQGGTVTFHYTPGADVVAGDQLTFGLDLLDVTTLVASGSAGPVTLAASAVSLKITLTGLGDGGINDDVISDASAGEVVNPNGKANGVPCATDDECGTAFCTDGVCCNERCKADVCASCNLPATKGFCTAYAVNTDPETECAAKIPTAPADTDGGADGAASDATAASDAATIATPDGGFVTMPTSCGGTCGGGRACQYPDQTKSCGTSFCNASNQTAAFVCDGKGGCGIALGGCTNYSCDDTNGACRTTCSDPAHCAANDYCTGTGACLAKKADSIPCTLPSECTSGNCSGGVCCNTACDGVGLTCAQAGHLGQCQCMGVTCAAGVACQIFYRDADGDTFGNASGTIAAGTATPGCMGVAPPAGFVADKTDCDDGDANVHPGQTTFFGTASKGIGTFDYDCDKTIEKQTPEYPGALCRFCGPTSNCAATTTSCTSTSQTESLACPLEGSRPILSEPLASLGASVSDSPGLTSRLAGGPSLIPIQPVYTYCCGCRAADKSGFTAAIKCGDLAFVTNCGSCNGSTATAASSVKTQQLCR